MFDSAFSSGLRAVTDLAEEFASSIAPVSRHELPQDPHRTAGDLLTTSPWQIGFVVQSFPGLHSYKVQLGGVNAPIIAVKLTEASVTPVGVRETAPIPPGSPVLVYMLAGAASGVIVGCIPAEVLDGSISCPDLVQQGSNTGFARDLANHYILEAASGGGGLKNVAGQRPYDTTSLEWGRIAETGVGIHCDAYQAYLRVNEACGLFLNYLDSYTRLAGLQLDIQTGAWNVTVREDEGECLHVAGHAVYPWEAAGAKTYRTKFTDDYDPEEVQATLNRGVVDLPRGREDTQSLFRMLHYGGYLGQGSLRLLAAPKSLEGIRQYSHRDDMQSLFIESVGLDGEYLLGTAKRLTIGKRARIPYPKQIRLPEDPTGDDSRESDYRFSGVFGEGEAHQIGSVAAPDDGMIRVAGLLDMQAHAFNWKTVHPFCYHQQDYDVPEPSAAGEFAATDVLDFSTLEERERMTFPEAHPLQIDHRYGEVSFYTREGTLTFEEDGSIVLADGYGSRIVMSGGQIRQDAPGDIQHVAGKRVVSMGWDLIQRAKNSIDFSATDKDIRLRANRNLQISGGDERTGGGVLIECRSSGKLQEYAGKYGEDVTGRGIVLLCKQGVVSSLSQDLYLRTGGESGIAPGNITIDAGGGANSLTLFSRDVAIFASQGINMWHTFDRDTKNADAVHRFAKDVSVIGSQLICQKAIVVPDGGVTATGAIVSGGSIIAKGVMAQGSDSGLVGDSSEVDLTRSFESVKKVEKTLREQGTEQFDARVEQSWYVENELGNSELHSQIGFSFRDPKDESTRQYRTSQFEFLEPRWVQMSRESLGVGGHGWKETGVAYQNAQTYPWPGRQKLIEEESMLCYGQHVLFDAAACRDKDRSTEVYLKPELSGWKNTTMDGNMKVVVR